MLDHFQQRVQDQGVGFLNSSAVGVGDNDLEIGFAFGLAATFAKERHGFYAFAPRGCEGAEDVGRIAARRKTNQQVIRVGQSFDLPGEDLVETVVVADAGEQGTIGDEADGGKGGSMGAKVTDQFLGEMHGVGGAASIAASKDFTTGFERGDGSGGDPLKRILLGGQFLQRAAGILNQLWQNGFHARILTVVTAGAKEKKTYWARLIVVPVAANRCLKVT
jgi:hypothetical protein